MGDYQPPLFAADELPPQREKRRRMPTTLPPLRVALVDDRDMNSSYRNRWRRDMAQYL